MGDRISGKSVHANEPVVTVVGVGNPYRRDDAVGWEIANRLKDKAPPYVSVLEMSGEVAALLEVIQSNRYMFIFDAVCSGAEAGAVLRFEAHKAAIPAKFFNYSTHAFGLAEAIELARAMEQMPEHLVVYGVECTDFDTGRGLSPEVLQAVPLVVTSAMRDIESLMEVNHARILSSK